MALNADRDTPYKFNKADVFASPYVAADVIIYKGALVVRKSDGLASPGYTAVNLKAEGVSLLQIDSMGDAPGVWSVMVRKGVHQMDNSQVDPVQPRQRGEKCYIVNDHVVAGNDGLGSRSEAGTIIDVDVHGVWVEFV